MFYLIDMYNGYKFLGTCKSIGALQSLIDTHIKFNDNYCIQVYNDKCKEKLIEIDSRNQIRLSN